MLAPHKFAHTGKLMVNREIISRVGSSLYSTKPLMGFLYLLALRIVLRTTYMQDRGRRERSVQDAAQEGAPIRSKPEVVDLEVQ